MTAANRFDVRGTIFDVSGRVALVTGSSRGLGAAMAGALAAAGATVVLNARADGALQDTRDRIAAATGSRVEAVAFDVCDEPAVDAAVARVEAEVGPVDILVNNAGVNHRVPMLDLELADWNRVLAANLTGPFLVGRAVARGMVARGRGKIVNIASLMSRLARPTVAPYAASKGGMAMLTRQMCAEWAPAGLQCNAIAPGYISTELTAPLVADPAFDAWLRGRTPAGRWGETDDLVGALLWLASDAGAWVNGQVIHLDGGMTAVV